MCPLLTLIQTIENKFTRTRARFTLVEKIVSAFFTYFSADARSEFLHSLGQKNLGAQILCLGSTWHELQRPMLPLFIYLCAWWRHLWTSVFHYLDPSLPLLKSGHEKLRARVLVNSFSMVQTTSILLRL